MLLESRLLLAAVFAVAGVGKIRDQAGFRQALIDFGVPGPLAPVTGLGVPLTELTVAAALVSTSAAWWGALGAVVLLFVFTLGITVNLLRGNSPDCHCFGQVHPEPASWRSVVRNAMLVLPAGFIVWHGREDVGPSLTAWIGHLTPFESVALLAGLITAIILTAQGWLILQLFRQYGRVLIRLESLESGQQTSTPRSPETITRAGIPVGLDAPRFTRPDINGGTQSLEDYLSLGKPVMLVFADPGCGSCAAILPEIGELERRTDGSFTVVLVSRGQVETNREKMGAYGFRHILLQSDNEVAGAYGVPGTPSVVIIHMDGTVASPTAIGVPAIQALLLNLSPAQPETAAVADS